VQVIAGAFNPDARQKLAEFIRLYKPTFPVGTVDGYFVNNYAQITPQMRPQVPFLFFIDRDRVIRAQYFGQDAFFNTGNLAQNIRGELDKLVAQKTPAPAKKAGAKKKGP
jgi:hypothetical protein